MATFGYVMKKILHA